MTPVSASLAAPLTVASVRAIAWSNGSPACSSRMNVAGMTANLISGWVAN